MSVAVSLNITIMARCGTLLHDLVRYSPGLSRAKVLLAFEHFTFDCCINNETSLPSALPKSVHTGKN